jgi:hypothetical protein
MDAKDVIDSYVHDVARRLPPGKRNDVAFELSALLTDDLQSRARAEGRAPDVDLAVQLVREFGRPTETAVRYYRPFTIVEPGDTWGFLVASVAGGFVLSLLTAPKGAETYGDAGERTTVAHLTWLGLLVVVFGAKSLILRRRPDAFAWKPRPVRDSDTVNRVEGAGLALLWSALLALYLAPGPVVQALSGGRVAARTLDYSDSFTSPLRMPWLVVLMIAVIAVHLVAVAQRRWRPATRWARIALTWSIGIQLGWHTRYGTIFEDPETDRLLVPGIAAVAGLILLAGGIQLYRSLNRVRPAPARIDRPAVQPDITI